MISERDIARFLSHRLRQYLPHLSIDCVVFGFERPRLKVLLLRWKGTDTWTLPGGFVERRESLDAAATRVLFDRTGLRRVYLRQFHAFGDLGRKERQFGTLLARLDVAVPRDAWPVGRVVSIGYYALVNSAKVRPRLDALSDEWAWWPVDRRPKLAFDHSAIVDRALETLRDGLGSHPIGSTLLPKTFTMPELQEVYEAILGRRLDRRNFQKRMRELGVLERLSERRRGGAHRAPYLYRFDRLRYARALDEGLSFPR